MLVAGVEALSTAVAPAVGGAALAAGGGAGFAEDDDVLFNF